MSTDAQVEELTPEITLDADIAEVGAAFRIDIDAERAAILNERATRDIRACPGSGKTTLLVAKMALLSKAWKAQHRGICVLSHTNVAKDEITKRLADFPSLSNLTSYPHFIGTIQSFVDQFLAIPAAIREFGVRPTRIDNDYYKYELLREYFGTPAYGTASAALRAAHNNDAEKVIAYLVTKIVFADENLTLPPQGFSNRPWGPDSQSFKELTALKMALSQRGIFTYEDMIALAIRYLSEVPNVPSAIASRFPIVFVDEMQDTSARTANLLEIAFSRCVIQRFGDDRQEIYSKEGNDVAVRPFPATGYLTMAKSFRLSPQVCSFALNVVCTAPEPLIGNDNNRDGRHTIFAFKSGTIDRVLPAFAELVATDVGAGLPAKDIRAVGGTVKCQDTRVPSGIGDYMPVFNKIRKVGAASLQTLHAYLKLAQYNVETLRRVGEAREVILDAILRLLRDQQFNNPVIDLRSRYFLPSLLAADVAKCREIEKQLARLVLDLCKWDGAAPTIARQLIADISSVVGTPWSPRAQSFIDTVDQNAVSSSGPSKSDDNVFRWVGGQGEVEILVDTIHSVKGETLKAILLLETFVYSHDLGKLIELGYLRGQWPANTPGVRVADHVKKVFVAMTRPTTLLCLAVCRDHLSDANIEQLTAMGWNVQEL